MMEHIELQIILLSTCALYFITHCFLLTLSAQVSPGSLAITIMDVQFQSTNPCF